ncbi:MAG: hypothetical protein JNJ45_05815 [Chthonomonas sp.]|nr:hypothetical protein [Chthonomonas sp.]
MWSKVEAILLWEVLALGLPYLWFARSLPNWKFGLLLVAVAEGLAVHVNEWSPIHVSTMDDGNAIVIFVMRWLALLLATEVVRLLDQQSRKLVLSFNVVCLVVSILLFVYSRMNMPVSLAVLGAFPPLQLFAPIIVVVAWMTLLVRRVQKAA